MNINDDKISEAVFNNESFFLVIPIKCWDLYLWIILLDMEISGNFFCDLDEFREDCRPLVQGKSKSFSMLSTSELLEKIKVGDSEAQNALYQRFWEPLRRWSAGRLPLWARGLAETDDLVQEVLLKSLQKVDDFQYRHRGCFQAYLRRSIINCIRDEIRRVARKPQKHETAGKIHDEEASPIEETIGRQTLARYERALMKLQRKDQAAILARIELDFSHREIANTLGLASDDAARMAVSRALVRLAKEMAHDSK